MTATCPATASYTFRSILHGRDLLREGVIWRIGDGSKVNIHHENWISRSGSMRPLGQVFLGGTKVADLISSDGRNWNMEKLNAMFSEDDAADIKQIAIGGLGTDDYLAWNFTKNGCFTVKSAYHLKMSMNRARTGRTESSSSVNTHKGYTALWDTSAPGKAKIHSRF